MSLFRRKSVDVLMGHARKNVLKRTLGAFDLTMMGIGVIVGAGIFVLTGRAAATHAGPAIMLSFVLSSIVCVLVCLAYAELASAIPIAGSAYTYTYASIGEFMAWLVGWGLVLEYTVGASAVAGGWSAYLVGLLESGGVKLPKVLTSVPWDGGLVNLPAMLIALFITLLLVRGVHESARVNRILVGVKLTAIFVFLFIAGPKVDVTNWEPFFPYGKAGISAGAAVIFFSYLGVDSLATAAEETRNPQRNMPLGIIMSLVVCTILYVSVSAVMTGAVPYTELNTSEPVAHVLRKLGYNFGSALVGVGAVAGLSTVCLVMIYAQTRAFFAMSRDGLLPRAICKVHPKYGTPHVITMIVGGAVALMAGFLPVGLVAELCNVGTLFAFVITTSGLLAMRRHHPDLPRPFRCPAANVVVPVAVASCLYIMASLPSLTLILFSAWTVIGVGVYFGYGRRNSLLGQGHDDGVATSALGD